MSIIELNTAKKNAFEGSYKKGERQECVYSCTYNALNWLDSESFFLIAVWTQSDLNTV